MGKAQNGQFVPSTEAVAHGTNPGSSLGCSRVQKIVSLRCILVLLFGVAVLLSAVFWLPIFHLGSKKDLDLAYRGHDIVASFQLNKSASFLHDYILQLQDDIFDEMSFANTRVEVISLDSIAGLNTTKVVFAVKTDVTTQSLIKSLFVSLITRQSFLHVTASLFGDPSDFEVLKFRGGITVSPEQNAFLLQSVQILFNFTLNFSIDEILENFDDLTTQLQTGLHLAPYENLFVRLTNLRGSTVNPPTTVQAQVLLAVGINPSESRLKQLAHTISDSHAKNLGLNNTVFGRVKQVRLSSILQHSLGGDGSPSPSPAPSPSQPHHHHHHHHHHHSHHHHHDASLPPSISPSPSVRHGGSITRKGASTSAPSSAPSPSPGKNKAAESPACPFGRNRFPWRHSTHSHGEPSASPVYAPHTIASPPKDTTLPTPKTAPAQSPLPNVAYAHSQPPTKGEVHARPPEVMALVSPSLSPSAAGLMSSNILMLMLPVFILLVLHL